METLSIEKSRVIKAYQTADGEVKKLLQTLFPTQFFDWKDIKTFEDACRIAGVDPGIYATPKNATDDQIGLIAFSKLQLIYKVFNQGWKPDWTSFSEWKYYPWFRYSAGSGFSYDDDSFTRTHTYAGSRLCTDTSEKAKYIGKTFIDIYNQFLSIH